MPLKISKQGAHRARGLICSYPLIDKPRAPRAPYIFSLLPRGSFQLLNGKAWLENRMNVGSQADAL
jgi:hypothetical protein